jgi:hypothetical protein
MASRPGFAQIPAVQLRDMYEIKSSLILQPGPAALTDGLAELQRIIERGRDCRFELLLTKVEGRETMPKMAGALTRSTATR